MSYFGRHPTLKSSGADQVESWIPGFAGMTRVVVFSHPPLKGRCRARSAGRRGVALTMAGHPSVWPSASHLPCQGRMIRAAHRR